MPKLTEKQKRFAEGIVSGLTQDAAYVKAGYKSRGVNARTAASRLSTNDNVQAYIAELRKSAVERTIVTASEAIETIAQLMRGEIETDTYVIQKLGTTVTTPPRGDTRLKAAVEVLKYHAGIYQQRGKVDDDAEHFDKMIDAIRSAANPYNDG